MNIKNIPPGLFLIFVLTPLLVLAMSQQEFEKTVEDVGKTETKISAEIEKIEKLLEKVDLLKGKFQILHKQIEKTHNKEIDSLEKTLNQNIIGLEAKIKELLLALKEDEKELKEKSKNIEKWKNQDLNNSMDSLYKRLYDIYKDSLYIKLPMLKNDTDSVCFPFDSLSLTEKDSVLLLLPVDSLMPVDKTVVDSNNLSPEPNNQD